MARSSQSTCHLFVTGGVASSLGKGLTASSLGRLLKARGLRVTMQKLDPYLNVDPGTMNPFQHGEVFVTDDGAETDLDVGHYERFLDEDLHGVAEILAPAFAGDHRAVDLAGRHVGRSAEILVEKSLVVADVEVCLCAVVRDEHLAVLEGRERAGIDVDVGVELLDRHPESALLEEPAEARRGEPFAQRGGDAAGDEDVLRGE